MAVDFQVQSQSHSSDPSQFADLDTQTQRGSYRMLSAAAGIYAAAYALAYLADWGILIGKTGHFVFPPLNHNIFSIVAIAYAVFVMYTSRKTSCTACRFTRMALSFLIVSSAGIALHAWNWEMDGHAGGVSWVGVWIVAYAGIVTLTPRLFLVGGLLSWAILLGVAVASITVHGVPADFPGSPVAVVAQVAIPVLICVFIAWAISFKVFKLARDVSKARRLGSYHLSEKIGSGGMGEVWRARHKLLARPAAVKLIRPESLVPGTENSSDARAMLKRFEREAQVTALLTSPHSVALYDFGIADDGVFYYVMELLEGRDLKTLVRESGPVAPERAVHFLREACDSLADAHDRGLIHRDIKPANIFTCRRGREFDFVKVLDFGLVKNVRDRGESVTELTGAGTTSGTPGFMAPEMITGEAVDARSDIYALGCVAYWLLTGQLVFEGNTPVSILIQHAKEEPPPLSSRTELRIPPRLEEIVHACLAKSPSQRPASADELGTMLAEVAADLPAWTRERAQHWWEKNLPNLYYTTARVDTAESGASTVVNV